MGGLAYPTVTAAGPPRLRGEQYGEQAAERIARSVAHYRKVFADLAGLSWSETLARADNLEPALKAYDADTLEEIRGIADGAGQPVGAIVALNCRTELMYPAPAHECTTAAVLPERSGDGHVLLVQNWDWLCPAAETVVLLRLVTADGLEMVSLHEAGMVARGGCNAAGVGAVGNFLATDTDRTRSGIPLPLTGRRILLSPRLADALAALLGAQRSVSTNYLLASAEGLAVDLEATSDAEHPVDPVDGVLTHANHFRTPGITDTYMRVVPDSLYRDGRMASLLAGPEPVTPQRLMAALRDHAGHPSSICRHPTSGSDDSATLSSLVMDLTTRELWITDGPPCTRPYHHLQLEPFAAPAPSLSS